MHIVHGGPPLQRSLEGGGVSRKLIGAEANRDVQDERGEARAHLGDGAVEEQLAQPRGLVSELVHQPLARLDALAVAVLQELHPARNAALVLGVGERFDKEPRAQLEGALHEVAALARRLPREGAGLNLGGGAVPSVGGGGGGGGRLELLLEHHPAHVPRESKVGLVEDVAVMEELRVFAPDRVVDMRRHLRWVLRFAGLRGLSMGFLVCALRLLAAPLVKEHVGRVGLLLPALHVLVLHGVPLGHGLQAAVGAPRDVLGVELLHVGVVEVEPARRGRAGERAPFLNVGVVVARVRRPRVH
mmetsp:Transcript_22019/g.64938  ORF Transcript_22019/g.64938 Transcript_22019/m.64938 type:complete len:301 (+) Transcript_22019:3831-4733(+)